MIRPLADTQLGFLEALYEMTSTGLPVVPLGELAARLGWEHNAFMEVSDSLLAIRYITVTPLGVSLSGFGLTEMKSRNG